MKWPKKIKHRKKVLAKVYRPCSGRDSYRVAWTAAGRRQMKSFKTYSGKGGALEFAEGLVSGLAGGSQITALTSKEVTDALTIRDALDAYRQDTGRAVTALQAVSGYLDAAKLLPAGHNLGEAVRGYLGTVAVVQRKPLAEAVAEF